MTSPQIDPLEKVIRPIVEGQIRGFLHEHPAIVNAVDWYKKRTDKVTTFTNSLSKRIVRDLTCAETRSRIEDALQEIWEVEKSGVVLVTAPDVADVGMVTDITTFPDPSRQTGGRRGPRGIRSARAVPSSSLLPEIQWGMQ